MLCITQVLVAWLVEHVIGFVFCSFYMQSFAYKMAVNHGHLGSGGHQHQTVLKGFEQKPHLTVVLPSLG